MVFHSKMVLTFRYSNDDGDDDERRCWWWDWRFWKPLPQQNGFGVQLTETISTAKWFWHSDTVIMTVMMMNDSVDDEIEDSGNHFHSKMGLEYNSQKPFHSKMVLAFRYGDDDGDDDERRCWWWDWRFQWWWWWTTVMIQFVSAFGSFCFVLFGFLWGVGSNYVGIYARCIRIS